ncbi:MAG: molybdate ABC transporter substrate-binding protein [Acidobacteria bacterium RIFCSPLOWO2_02_FULL_65_29]|nr:MAG: molybdate ABC transporter substrate-binding protein [Acidobacteria bacterium RIFCSPLOWO2_02_FULL_65_29]
MRWPGLRTILIITALIACAGTPAAAQQIAVAAAADLQAVFPEVAARFERETGRKVALTFGSSGNFFAQVQNGAPFDLFFSADIEYPRRLQAAGLAESGSLYEYATGRLVLWSRKDSGIDAARGLMILADPRVRRVAIANPEHAPYGRAAVAALRHETVYDAVRGKLVLGENISQAAQFAQSGNADAGILALSLALMPALRDTGTVYRIPDAFYPPIVQGAVVLAASRQKEAARQFLRFVERPDIQQLMREYGFAPAADLR